MDHIAVVIQGTKPDKLREEVEKLIDSTCYVFPQMKLDRYFLCPQCLTNMILNSGQTEYMELPEDVIKSKFNKQELEEKVLIPPCPAKSKHRLQKLEIVNGYYPFEETKQTSSSMQKIGTDGVCWFDALIELVKGVTESLEKLEKKGIKVMPELSDQEFNESFVFNESLRELLVPNWLTFGNHFSNLNKAELESIKNHAVPQSEHFTMLLMQLRNRNPHTTVSQFLRAVIKTSEL